MSGEGGVVLKPIAKAVTDEDGSFDLVADTARARAANLVVGQSRDYTIVLQGADGEFTTLHGSMQVGADEIASARHVARDGLLVGTDLSLSANSIDVELKTGDSSNLRGSLTATDSSEDYATEVERGAQSVVVSSRQQVVASDATTDETNYTCSYSEKDLGKRRVNVGSVLLDAYGVTGRVIYKSGTESTLGVGVSGTGKFGSFTSSGSVNRKSTSTVKFGRIGKKTSEYFDTYFRFSKYCVIYHSPGPTKEVTVKATNFSGGAPEARGAVPPDPSRSYCVPYAAGSESESEEQHAITWTNGAKLGGKIGIDLSSRTGFSSTSQVNFVFNKTRKLCGTHGDPGDSPRMLVVKPRSY
ncbi:hypothetical protein [Nocardioides bruguierae]|nr:hypothetical protein [Nocardioides bruguierae]